MAESVALGGHDKGFASTKRRDRWWAGPLATGVGLGLFIIYATWAAFQGQHYWVGPMEGFGGYLSPLYSPVLFTKLGVAGGAPIGHAWLGEWPAWWPAFLPASPAFFILAFPGAFRVTCYYYRKAYYRAYFFSPPACAVNARPQTYKGETNLLLFQNLHRYALYFALIFIVILSYDAVLGFFRNGVPGVGVGSIVLLINVILLGGYTFGCHTLRHLVGGRLDCFSCDGLSRLRHKAWGRVSWLNARHMLFAWMSLFWVGFTDVYVRLVSMGVITDLNTWE